MDARFSTLNQSPTPHFSLLFLTFSSVTPPSSYQTLRRKQPNEVGICQAVINGMILNSKTGVLLLI